MVWLIGNKGMLGSAVERSLMSKHLPYIHSDLEVDITNGSALRSHVGSSESEIEWIINCSAYTAVDQAEDESEKAFKINADGVSNIVSIAKSLNATLIHISTDYVFNGKKKSEYVEEDEPEPVGVYGKSKWEGEKRVIRSLKNYYIFRTAWLYGRNGKNFVDTMLRLFRERDTVKVVADQRGSPTYAKDLSNGIIRIVQEKAGNYGVYHFSNLGKTTWYDFARKIHDKALEIGLIDRKVNIIPIKTEEYPTRAIRPRNSCLSKEKIMKTFDLPIRNWQDALEEYLRESVS